MRFYCPDCRMRFDAAKVAAEMDDGLVVVTLPCGCVAPLELTEIFPELRRCPSTSLRAVSLSNRKAPANAQSAIPQMACSLLTPPGSSTDVSAHPLAGTHPRVADRRGGSRSKAAASPRPAPLEFDYALLYPPVLLGPGGNYQYAPDLGEPW